MPKAKNIIERAKYYTNKRNLKFRPEKKTNNLSETAKSQLDADACGINCQKVSEARAVVGGLASDIRTGVLLDFNIIGKRKIQFFAKSIKNCAKYIVDPDNFSGLEGT